MTIYYKFVEKSNCMNCDELYISFGKFMYVIPHYMIMDVPPIIDIFKFF